MQVVPNDRVYAEGYGPATVEQVAEFDTIIQIRLDGSNDTAWTDRSLVRPLDY